MFRCLLLSSRGSRRTLHLGAPNREVSIPKMSEYLAMPIRCIRVYSLIGAVAVREAALKQ